MTKKVGKKHVNILLIYTLFLIMLIVNVKAECVEPESGSFIKQNTILCNGTYYLNKGIAIINDNINIDCKNANIVGDKTSIGFLIENSINTTIQDCNLNNFLIGIQASKSTSIKLISNVLNNNSIGIKLDNVNKAFLNNIFIDNKENISKYYECIKDNFCPDECYLSDPDCNIVQIPVKHELEETKVEEITKQEINKRNVSIENTISEDILSKIQIRKLDHNYAVENIVLLKTKKTENNKTIFEITLKARKDIKGLVIYEHFSKDALGNANLISSKYPFEIIEQDPLIKIEINKDLKKGSEQTITYEVNKIIDTNNPISIITIEAKRIYIKWLMGISVILYLIFILINWRLKSKYKGLMNFIKSYSNRHKEAKNKLLRMGWPAYQIDEAICLVKEEKISNSFKKCIKVLRSSLAETTFVAYILIFGFPDLNMKILPSEILTVIFFSIVNIILILLIIQKGIVLLKWGKRISLK